MVPILIALMLGTTVQLFAQVDPSEDDLFDQVFGASATEELVVPVTRDGRVLGEVLGRVSSSVVLVSLPDLLDAVGHLLNASTRASLQQRADAAESGMVEVGSLNDLGVFTRYRRDVVELEVRIAADRLGEQVINADTASPLFNVQEPAPLSGYVNLRARTTVSSQGDVNSLEAEVEPVVNVNDWVAEGNVTVRNTEPRADVIAARIVRDRPADQIRLEAGTARYLTGDLVSSPALWGVSATRRADLLPDRPLFRDGSTRFVVPDAGPVELYLNGRLFRSFSLSQGPHTVVDLPLGQGSNAVEVIQPGGGSSPGRTLLAEQIPFAPGLLRPGRHRFSYAVGVLRDDPSVPLGSVFHHMGLLRELTAGVSAQGSPEGFVAAVDALGAGEWGITRVQAALSTTDGVGTAAAFTHVVSVLHSRWTPSVEFVGAVQSTRYVAGAVGVARGAEARAGVVYSQRLPGAVNAAVGVAQRWALDQDGEDETEVRLVVSHQSSRGFSLNAQLGPQFDDDGVTWRGGVFVRVTNPPRTMATSVGYDMGAGPATISVQAIPRRSVNTLRWSAAYQGFDRMPNRPQVVRGRLGFDGYRSITSVEPLFQRTIGAEESEVRLTGRYATAVAFVGSSVALSRPIDDSFVMLKPREQITPYAVPVRRGGGGVVAIVDGGATVVPGLRSYLATTIAFDGVNLPDGFSLGDEGASFTPGYRNGYLVTVGSSAAVYVTGRLVDGIGEPIPLEAGEVVASDGKTLLFFTNQAGEFEITELEAGEYRLRLFSDDEAETVFAVPPDVVGRYELEDVVFLREEL